MFYGRASIDGHSGVLARSTSTGNLVLFKAGGPTLPDQSNAFTALNLALKPAN